MDQLVDVANRQNLHRSLQRLTPLTVPLWGKMEPQQMVEHMIDQVQYTNGKKIPFCDVPADEAEAAKQRNIYTDLQIPRNVILGKLPDSLIYPDLETAVTQLMAELDDFDRYFKKPGTVAIHGGFGPMNYDEWLIWHSKHFMHHLKQFGLILS